MSWEEIAPVGKCSGVNFLPVLFYHFITRVLSPGLFCSALLFFFTLLKFLIDSCESQAIRCHSFAYKQDQNI